MQHASALVAQVGTSWTMTWTIAPAPKPNRNAATRALKAAGADPRAQHRGRAGEQAERGQPAQRASLAAIGATIAEALRRVVQREADDQERAQRQRARRE